MDSAPVLQCTNVAAGRRSARGGGPEEPILTEVELTLTEGGALVVLGPSGSGKTTLLRLLNRFEDPLSGTICFRGAPLPAYDPLELRRRVSLVPQTPVLFEGTVADNLALVPKGQPEPDRAALSASLSQVGLDERFLDRPARELSLGEKQRVALARALVRRPEVLLLDEPTSALDHATTTHVVEHLLSLRREQRLSLVIVTHQPEVAQRMQGDVLMLRHGRTVRDPGPDAIARFLGN